MAAIEYRGLNAVTNFDLSRYIKWLKPNNNNNNNNNNDQSNPNVETNMSPTTNHSIGLISTSTSTSTSTTATMTSFSAASIYSHLQLTTDTSIPDVSAISQNRSSSATSALGLLLQSTKFKEMMEMTLAAECPPAPIEISDPEPPQNSSFPEDIKTYFDNQEFGNFGHHDQEEDMVFNEINSFMPPLMQFD